MKYLNGIIPILVPINLTPQFKQDLSILKQAADSGLIKKYEEMVQALPKYIVPSRKAAYDDLLERLNEFAMAARGRILGIVSYEKWEATIQLTAPILRFTGSEGILLLADIALSSENVTISVNSEGVVCLNIVVEYFRDMGDKEAIMDELIEQDDSLIESILASFCDLDNADCYPTDNDL